MRNHFFQSAHFSFKSNVFYQKGLQIPTTFEKVYLSLREKEHRLFPDEIVRSLPDLPRHHPLQNEWELRKSSLKRLMNHLVSKDHFKHPHILEIGCGNGWLSNHLAKIQNSDVVAIDVNETELLQAARVFNERKNLHFVCADILTVQLPKTNFDYIILASSIHYFPQVRDIIRRLLELLGPSGEILILDTPFYPSRSKAREAQLRSLKYFHSLGFPEMSDQYFHHHLGELRGLHYSILFNPSPVMTLIHRTLFRKRQPVFPIIQIKNP